MPQINACAYRNLDEIYTYIAKKLLEPGTAWYSLEYD